ncbi:MAG: hypothetical protein LBD94_00005, partial [Rickettsiales bacterium]|nr:hypothetical protein [Rickettsiales bacterium]
MNKIIAVLFAVFAGASFADEVARSSRGAQSEVRIQRTDNVRDSKTEASRVAVKNSVVEQTSAVRTTRGGAAETRTQKSETRNPQIGASVVAPTRAAATRAVLHTNSTSENAQSGSGRGVVSSGAGSARSISRSSTQSLRSSGVEADGRAVVGRGNSVTGSDIEGDIERKTMRRVARAATDNPFLAEAVSVETPSAAGELADCSVAYFECLDQFCNVLDANQKQCSCSGRLEQYKKVEDSLTKATEELNNVAQQIRYVGLSADEVRSILKETEAEEVLSSLEDKTQSRNMLEEIEKIIKDPDSGFSSSSNMTLDFELDFSGSSSDFDLGSMFGNNESFANMRGTELYSAAKKKCSAILSRCAPKKADQSIISGQYDIEIDKTCVAYEAGLKKATSNVRTNIKSATSMLQKARLAVMADQNSYDARGCVSALDTCMRDEMVCGSNYYKCLDPTKVAIDENGSVVPGGDVVSIRNLMSSYSAVKLDELLSNPTCSSDEDNHNGCKVVNYLKSKIGVMENGRIKSGFCRPVLEKCRLATYEEGQYIENNTVVKSYLERTMTQVNAAQNSIISEYAKSCVSDVSTCYNNQITQVNSYAGGTSLSPSVLKPILMGACRNVALSCAYAVFSEIDTGG